MEVLTGCDVQVQQPRQREVDVGDLVECDALVDAAQLFEVSFGERERRRRPQPCPFVTGEPDVGGQRIGRHAGTSTPGRPASSCDARLQLVDVRRGDRDVADLAAGAWRLRVVVEVGTRDGEHRTRVGNGADAVDHRVHADRGRRAERPAEDRSEMVLELARDRALDGPVTGVVHAGRELVDEQLSVHVEELDGEDTHVLELVEELPDEPLRRGLEPLGHARRRSEAAAQDPAVVVVLDQRPARGCAVAAARPRAPTAHGRTARATRGRAAHPRAATTPARRRPVRAEPPAPCRRIPLGGS